MSIKDYLPLTREGRQTLVYLNFIWAGLVLAALVWWAMEQALSRGWQALFVELSRYVAIGLLIDILGLAMFVSLRAFKLGSDGISAFGDPE